MRMSKKVGKQRDQFLFQSICNSMSPGAARLTLTGRVPTSSAQAVVPSRAGAFQRRVKKSKVLKPCPKCHDPHSVTVKIYNKVKRVEYCINHGCGYSLRLPDVNLAALVVCLSVFFLAAMAIPCFAGEVDITRAVIHHTASHDVSAKTIDQWHRQRGWDGIGYHFVVRKDGKVESGRDIHKKGAHAKGRNHYIGIALTGHNEFTAQQLSSLRKLLKRLGVRHVERHHEQCPGGGINIEKLQKELDQQDKEGRNGGR